MNRKFSALVGLGLTLGIGACSGSTSVPVERLASSSSPLIDTGSIPYPVKVVNGQPVIDPTTGKPLVAWDGSVVDLMAADSWAQCASGVPDIESHQSLGDQYLVWLEMKMSSMICASPAPSGFKVAQPLYVPDRWAAQRLNPDCNVDPSTLAKKAVSFTNATMHAMPPYSGTTYQNPAVESQSAVSFAEVNLCMAQRMREYASAGNTLMMSAEDQRELLEITRERAQLAMLQYAQLGVVFASGIALKTVPTTIDPHQSEYALQRWALDPVAAPALEELGRDYANAVQLHSVVTTELAQLLWRSASARLTRETSAAVPTSPADEAWGPSSWRQRMLAALYGGEVLIGPAQPGWSSTQWSQHGGKSVPLARDVAVNPAYPLDWPGKRIDEPGFAAVDASAPEVGRLLGLARAYDAIDLKVLPASAPATYLGIDPDGSATRIFNAVEANLWSADCLATTPKAACAVSDYLTKVKGTDINATYETSSLWTRHRIAPAHAKTLAAQLAEAIPRAVVAGGARTSSLPAALRLSGSANAYVTNADGDWYHVDPSVKISGLDLVERAPLFTRLTTFAPSIVVDPASDGWPVGRLEISTSDDDSARTMGAVSALAAVREALQTALSTYAVAPTGYFSKAWPILDIIDASIGGPSVNVRPVTQKTAYTSTCDASHSALCWRRTQVSSGANLTWEVGLSLPAGHAFAPATGATFRLAAIPNGMLATMLAASPGAKSFLPGTATAPNTIVGLMSAASANRLGTLLNASTLSRASDPELSYRRWTFNLPSTGDPRWSFVLEKTALDPKTNASVITYLPLGESVYLHTATEVSPAGATINLPVEGQYLAYGGSFGVMARQAWSPQQDNWSQPQFDAYGIPMRWVPPADPSLFGGQAGESAHQYYLRSASQAAAEATTAVKSAVDELIEEQRDDATLASAQRRAAEVNKVEQRSLCGDANPKCDASTFDVQAEMPNIDVPWDCTVPNVDYDGISVSADYTSACQGLQLSLGEVFASAATSFALGKAVADTRKQQAVPSFSTYAGGALQSVYIEQWSALRHIENVAREALAQAKVTLTQTKTAYLQKAFADYEESKACSPWSFYKAYRSGLSIGNGGVSFSEAPLWGQSDKCTELRARNKTTGNSQIVLAQQDGFAHLASMTTALADAAGALQLAAAKGARASEDARLAIARSNLEASLAADTVVTKFGTFRRYHSYDMWRARALLESARRYAATARRSIEGRYVLDLSKMDAAEPFVAAPATWADDIYQYDLAAPAAVGLSVTSGQADGLYPNKLGDYVENLDRLVQGYAVARPAAVTKEDSEVLSLVGPDVHTTAFVNGTSTDVIAGDAARWQFFCSSTNDWKGHPAASQAPATASLSTVCDAAGVVQPTKARIAFSLDPWGRVDGNVADEPYAKRFNARWTRFALNLVGTGVKDCTRAADPHTCYTAPFVRFDLTHAGPAWVTNYEQQWRVLGVSSGQIEGGKALAAEEWLDPVNNGWSKSSVLAVKREELADRPFGGTYVLELKLDPEVRPERIESLQILVQSTYWVKQQ